MSVLLIGCGYWGQNWAKTLHAIHELGAVCDARTDIQVRLKENYPGLATYDSPQDALRHPGVEAVIIATPVITHREIARQCLLAGKHILVEKPLTLKADEADELVRLADGGGLMLAVGHLLLYHPALRTLKALMASGELGEILGVQCTRINLGKVRNEESVWWSLAPHDLSILDMLLGEPLTAMAAAKMNLLKRVDIEDSVYASFITPSGREASIHVSWLSPVKRHETMVIGSRGIAVFEDTAPEGEKLKVFDYCLDRTGEIIHGIRKEAGRTVPVEGSIDDLLTAQARAFLETCRGQRDSLPNDGRNAYQVVRLLADVQDILTRELPGKPVRLPV